MINPMRSVYLNNRWYNYVSDSPSKNVKLKNSVNDTQNSRTFSCQGGTHGSFTLTLALDNTYEINVGESNVGSTTWLGVSRLADLQRFAGAKGVSMPITFVCPWGVTYDVIPTGSLDISMNIPSAPKEAGTEFRVSLTLNTK